jgi:hypothetical protein
MPSLQKTLSIVNTLSIHHNAGNLLRIQYECHPRDTCSRPDRGVGIQNYLKLLDSRLRENDTGVKFLILFKIINFLVAPCMEEGQELHLIKRASNVLITCCSFQQNLPKIKEEKDLMDITAEVHHT